MESPSLTTTDLATHQAASLRRPRVYRLRRRGLRAAGAGYGGRRRLDANVSLARRGAYHRRCRWQHGTAIARGRAVAALVGRRARLRWSISPQYVFVPAYAIAAGGVLPPSAALAVSLIDSSHRRALFCRPTDENRRRLATAAFRRCGAIVAFYLFLLKPAPWLGALAVAALAAATFAPIYFVHPVRVPRWRRLNLAMLVNIRPIAPRLGRSCKISIRPLGRPQRLPRSRSIL